MPTVAQALAMASDLLRQGDLASAESVLRQIVEQVPQHAEAHHQLGLVLAAQGRLAEAVPCFRRVTQLQPHSATAHHNHGYALAQAGDDAGAVAAYRQALTLRPDYVLACLNLGNVLARLGDAYEARRWNERAARIAPSGLARYMAATVLPVIPQSAEELQQARRRMHQELQSLVDQGTRIDPLHEPIYPPFYLAYHGHNDRAIYELIGRLCRPAAPVPARPASAGERIRVGFASEFFRDHTIGQQWQGIIARLSRESFEVTAFSFARNHDAVAEAIRKAADHYVELPPDLAAARQWVAGAGLDVLVYPDVGMNRESYALALSRLAPVQCVGWGHPVTSGLPTVDYFLSSELLETGAADEHYTERLVRLKTLGLYLDRPRLPWPPKTRADFGLPEGKHLYGCLQNLFKLQPDDDAVLAEILRRDPQGELVLIAGLHPQWEELLRRRFERSMGDCLERVRFVPRQTSADFLRLAALVDVSLDPLHFSGGRTSYEAVALGTPVVTLPSPYLRGRITLGVYLAIGVLDCVAESRQQYVELAVRLAGDAPYRAAVRQRLLARCDKLFECHEAVRELEDFFRRVAGRRG